MWGLQYQILRAQIDLNQGRAQEALELYLNALNSVPAGKVSESLSHTILSGIRLSQIFASNQIEKALDNLQYDDIETAYRLSQVLKNLDKQKWKGSKLFQIYPLIRDQALMVYNDSTNKRGLRTVSGEIYLEPTFDFIYQLSKGLVVTQKDGEWYFHYRDMRPLNKKAFEEAYLNPGGYHRVRQNGLYNYVDHQGEVISKNWVPEALYLNHQYPIPFPFNGLWGYIDEKGNWLIHPRFDSAEPFSDGKAKIVFQGKQGFIDSNGYLLFQKENTEFKRFTEGLAPIGNKASTWGFVNEIGQIRIPVQYEEVSNFYYGFAAVKKDGKWGIIDTSNRFRCPPKFKSIKRSFDGNFWVATDCEGVSNIINVWGTIFPDTRWKRIVEESKEPILM